MEFSPPEIADLRENLQVALMVLEHGKELSLTDAEIRQLAMEHLILLRDLLSTH